MGGAARLLGTDGKPLYTVHQLRHTRGTELTEHGQRRDIVQQVRWGSAYAHVPGPHGRETRYGSLHMHLVVHH